MPDIEILFEDPPMRGGGERHPKGTHAAVAARLKERPGQWAWIQTLATTQSAAGQADAVRTARLKAYAPARSFEAKSRTVGGAHRLYVRFVGGATSE